MIPRATYRLQFHKDFRFEHAAALADYFASLGISHIYSSPILKARAGSLHGYDVVDHAVINPELGGEDGFRAMTKALRAHGIDIILDIVPNHMAVGKADNAWWLDVLRNGPASAYAHYFDIDWNAPGLEDKVLAPFLDGTPAHCLETGDLRLVREAGMLAFAYFDHRFPLRPEDDSALAGAEPATFPRSRIESLLARQHFVLADWREADTRINWRRFFDITELAALRPERDDVFEAIHAKIFALCEARLVAGLRIDHIDGLADPRAYCRKLRQRLDACLGRAHGYLIVEKILAFDEALPSDWGVDGTTGYEFMNDVSALLHARDDTGRLSRLWAEISGRPAAFEPEELAARGEILARNFAAQREALVRAAASGQAEEATGEALSAIIGHLRCYRTYATGQDDPPPPTPLFDAAVADASGERPDLQSNIAYLAGIIGDTTGRDAVVDIIRRFNQLAAPVAAKAVEDTAFYRYGRLLSRTDVGFDPRVTGLSVADFHARIAARSRYFPHTMVSTATHDHKRGEDARARLAVLSEIPDLWAQTARPMLATAPAALDPGDVYQLLQSLLGAWPPAGLPHGDEKALGKRIAVWCRKYLREGKLRSSWQSPDTDYENRLIAYAQKLVTSPDHRTELERLLGQIEAPATANSVVQTVLRCTVPGVPDVFQGRERWDFSLVDPDNRRAVDYAARASAPLEEPLQNTVASWRDGAQKQRLLARLLHLRRDDPELFAQGDYRPITVTGPRADHVIAFRRSFESRQVVVVAALRCASALLDGDAIMPSADWWDDTVLALEDAFPQKRDVLSGKHITSQARQIATLLAHLPACVVIGANH